MIHQRFADKQSELINESTIDVWDSSKCQVRRVRTISIMSQDYSQITAAPKAQCEIMTIDKPCQNYNRPHPCHCEQKDQNTGQVGRDQFTNAAHQCAHSPPTPAIMPVLPSLTTNITALTDMPATVRASRRLVPSCKSD